MSIETEVYYIPKYLDEPERIMFWSIDEIIVMLVPMIVIGFCFNHFIHALLVSTIALLNWKRFKGSEQANLHLYILYWFYPHCVTGLKATPKSYIKTYFG